MYEHDDRFDCDPADCNYGVNELDEEMYSENHTAFARNSEAGADAYIVKTDAADTETADDFGTATDAADTETADDFGIDCDSSDETAATDIYDTDNAQDGQSGGCGCGGDCGNDCDTETADDFGTATDAADTETADDFGIDCDTSDETAATTDDCGCCCDGDCGTAYAQSKCALDDYEIISDVLGSEKQLVKLYSAALCESAEEPLRDVIKENLIEAAADQYATFEYMEKRGMYNVEQADEKEIAQAKQYFRPLCD